MLKLYRYLIITLFSLLLYSCTKELSLEGTSGGTSVFTFAGAPGACANASVTGPYEAGIALGATNLVNISVDVTTIGSYTVFTNNINGISFTGSGFFSATGLQTITLTGTGTPAAAGAFSFTPGPTGCSFLITVNGGAGLTAVYTLEGAPGACTTATPAGTYASGIALTTTNTVTISVNVTTVGTYSISTPTVNGFAFSGSGSFVNTGLQTVTLTGAGTPAADGVSIFTPPNGCSFSITVGTGTTPVDFLRCTIDGVVTNFNVDLIQDHSDPSVFQIEGAETSASTSPFFGIELTKTPAITTGLYNQFSITNTNTFCIVVYSDGVDIWSIAAAGQTPGISVDVTGYTANKIEGTFAGTIFSNLGSGATPRVITAGQFSISY